MDRAGAAGETRNSMPLSDEHARQRVGDRVVVLNDQDRRLAHRVTVPARRPEQTVLTRR